MKPADYQRLREVFFAAREREGEEREVWLVEVCGEDEGLLAGVRRLLASGQGGARFLGLADTADASGLVPQTRRGDAGTMHRPVFCSPALRCLRIAVALLVACSVSVAQQAERPNVIVIVSDDQGWADIGYHNPLVYSPRLDALAASGVRFSQHYVMPQCTPTRVALMTGRYPSRFGPAAQQANNAPAFPKGTPTLGTMFLAEGYETYLCGKWHLGSSKKHGPNHHGFQHSYGSLAGAVGMYDHRYRKGKFADTWHRDGDLIEGFENGVHATDLVASEAARVIEAERDQPYFLYVAFHAVHTPLDERGRFVDRPTQLDPEDPTRWLDEDEIPWFHDPKGLIQRETDPEKRLLLAAVHHLDHAIGQLVDAVERSGKRKDTLILFTSDNGPQGSWPGNGYPDDLKLTNFNQPLPMRGKKTDVYEGGTHVPGFAVWPGRIGPRQDASVVHVIDWFPTLAKLIGYRPKQPIDWDGVD
ncbi:MAG: sulfatase-like hydrolase/transferase, partial [Planctomycetota bacterium]|nr:sulfatase-like hydrolase/transferase [Planctomycetota bacterium]